MWDLEQQPIGHDIPYKRPPLHPNCRSVMLLVTKYSEEWGKSTRASADSEVDSKTTYEDWLKGKSEQEQDKILGKGKAQMWREGKITLRDMLDQTGRELSLKELVALHGNSAANHAKQILKQAEKHEPQITQVLQQASKEANATMTGLEYKLKSEASLARKIKTDAIKDAVSYSETAKGINDALRYTMIFDAEKFVNQYAEVRSALEKKGFNWLKVKNTWQDGAVYKGVNTVLEFKGQRFELQFHTQESYDLKNGELHELYERARLPNTAIKEKEQLLAKMKALSATLRSPNNIGRVK